MINTIIAEQIVGSYKQALTGQTIQVYAYHASDVAGAAPNGALIGTCTEVGNGTYTINLSESQKVTIVNGGLCVAGQIGKLLHGEKALNDSVDTSAIEDSAVTPTKASFVEDF